MRMIDLHFLCYVCQLLLFPHDCLTVLKSRKEYAGLKKIYIFPNIKYDPLVIFSQN